jgi:hypothetical protein
MHLMLHYVDLRELYGVISSRIFEKCASRTTDMSITFARLFAAIISDSTTACFKKVYLRYAAHANAADRLYLCNLMRQKHRYAMLRCIMGTPHNPVGTR